MSSINSISTESGAELLPKRDLEFTHCNLEIDQLCNAANISTMIDHLNSGDIDPVVEFLGKLNRNASKIVCAVDMVEDCLRTGERVHIDDVPQIIGKVIKQYQYHYHLHLSPTPYCVVNIKEPSEMYTYRTRQEALDKLNSIVKEGHEVHF